MIGSKTTSFAAAGITPVEGVTSLKFNHITSNSFMVASSIMLMGRGASSVVLIRSPKGVAEWIGVFFLSFFNPGYFLVAVTLIIIRP